MKKNGLQVLCIGVFLLGFFTLAYSSDKADITWLNLKVSTGELGEYRFFKRVAWDGRRFYLLAQSSGKLFSSETGASWRQWRLKTTARVSDLCVVNGILFLRLDGLWAAKTGGDWQPLVAEQTLAPVWNGNQYYLIAPQTVYHSPDAQHWRAHKSNPPGELNSIRWQQGRFIADVGQQQTFSSTDAVSWQGFHPNTGNFHFNYWQDRLYASATNLPLVRVWDNGQWRTAYRPKLGPMSQDNNLVALEQLFALGAHISWTADGQQWYSHILPGFGAEAEQIAGGMISGQARYLVIGTDRLLVLGVAVSGLASVKKEVSRHNSQAATVFQ